MSITQWIKGMRYQGMLVTLWMVGAFAIGTMTFSAVNGVALSFGTTFLFWALLEFRDQKS